jgi:hypothetical protein
VIHIISEAIYIPESLPLNTSFSLFFTGSSQELQQYTQESIQKKTEFYQEEFCSFLPMAIQENMREIPLFQWSYLPFQNSTDDHENNNNNNGNNGSNGNINVDSENTGKVANSFLPFL